MCFQYLPTAETSQASASRSRRPRRAGSYISAYRKTAACVVIPMRGRRLAMGDFMIPRIPVEGTEWPEKTPRSSPANLADLTRSVEQLAAELAAVRSRADNAQERADTQQERIDLAARALAEVSQRIQAAADALRESL